MACFIAIGSRVSSPRSWPVVLGLGLLLLGLAGGVCRGEGKDGGEFDGAVWKFQLTPKPAGGDRVPLSGRYRIAENVLYQRRDDDDKEFSKKVGKNKPNGATKTKVEFTDLRAVAKGGAAREGIKGTATLTKERHGEWSGTFVDGDGDRWEFHCSRYKE